MDILLEKMEKRQEERGHDNTAVDSLLREIDQEMSFASKQIPLQEIGDETMERIVSYNTFSNSNSNNDYEDVDAGETRPLIESQSRKSVMFDDDFKLHEYSVAEESKESIDAAETATAWVKPEKELTYQSSQEPLLQLESDEEEIEEPALDLTAAELKLKLVTDTGKKLDCILDKQKSSPNVPKLKEMVDNIDRMVISQGSDEKDKEKEKQLQPLKFKIMATSPLNSGVPSNEVVEYDVNSEEESEDALPQMTAQQRIPMTNVVSINKFTENCPTTSRISSGSSIEEAVTELKTTTKQDSFNLLYSSNDKSTGVVSSPQIQVEDYKFSSGSMKCVLMSQKNGSRIFSIATTADEYESAKEYESKVSLALDDQNSVTSVEDLGISRGLERDEETFKDLAAVSHSEIGFMKACEKKQFPQIEETVRQSPQNRKEKEERREEGEEEEGREEEKEEEEEEREEENIENSYSSIDISNALELPKLPPLDLSFVEIAMRRSSSNSTTNSHPTNSVQTQKKGVELSIEADDSINARFEHTGNAENVFDSRYVKKVAQKSTVEISAEIKNFEESNPSLLPEEGGSSNESEERDEKAENIKSPKKEYTIPSTNFSNDLTSESVKEPVQNPVEDSAGKVVLKSLVEHHVKNNDEVSKPGSIATPSLPPLPAFGSVFDEDYPFGDDQDISNDSIDITKSLKPSDYLSIWHTQENLLKNSSPAVSVNSQFSQQSESTLPSSIRTNTKFKFKPRVVSRSKICYNHLTSQKAVEHPIEDELFLSQTTEKSVLDPLRRNTLLSKKIQEQIKTHEHSDPHCGNLPSILGLRHQQNEEHAVKTEDEEVSVDETHDDTVVTGNSVIKNALDKNVNTVKQDQTLSHEGQSSVTAELLPSVAGDYEDVEDDFETFIKALNDDDASTHNTVYNNNRNSIVYHIWGEDFYQNGLDLGFKESGQPDKKRIPKEILTKLLAKEEIEEKGESVVRQNEKTPEVAGLGLLKYPESSVSVCRKLSIKGLEVVRSASDTFKSQKEETTHDIYDTPKKQNRINNSHVGSPFKVIRTKELDELEVREANLEVGSPDRKTENEIEAPVASNVQLEDKPHESEATQEVKSTPSEPLQDNGKLYVLLKGITGLNLKDVKRHQAEYAIEFDNGKNVVQTSWCTLPEDGSTTLNKEFEVILGANEPRENEKLIITLKCRYQRPKSELVEVVNRIPLKKKFPLGKTKYKLEKKYIQKHIEFDDWDYLFANDGSFARCCVELDRIFLAKARYSRKQFHFNLVNEWEKVWDKKTLIKDIYNLPRKPTHTVGTLTLDACYLPRTSPLERFPKTLKIAQEIVNKYAEQQRIEYDGYLWQEGGDVDGMLQKRYFTLQGNRLIAHHEITKKPKVLVNLLRVVDILSDGSLHNDTAKKVRNFTDVVLFSDCFKLIFSNGEVINLNAESTKSKDEWIEKLTNVIQLNNFHQPWVKHFLQNTK